MPTSTTSPPLVALPRGRPYINFINSIKSDKTKQAYRKAVLRFLANSKLSSEEMLTLPILDIENMITDYLTDLKKRDLSSGFVSQKFSALKKFYFLNEIRINKEKIDKFLGEQKKKNTNRAYTHQEIKTLLDVCDLRLKVVVLVLASTGMRIGAKAPLQGKHLEKKDDYGVYKFIVYENTKD
ncbi:MAG: hypothetical protein M3530_04265 [Thermoproteota archaeon]|nr:hypothetical protein [Thermoproteota archaeon]